MLIPQTANFAGDALENWITDKLYESMQFCFALVSYFTKGFWDHPVVTTIFGVVTSISMTVFVTSLIIMLANIAQEKAMGNPVPVIAPIKNVVKGVFFATAAVTICQYMFYLVMDLISSLPILFTTKDSTWTSLFDLAFGNTGIFDPMSFLVKLIVLLVCSISGYAFLFYSMALFIHLFVHGIGAVMLIPDIVVQGDGSAVGGWLKTAVVYGLTFIIQTLMFRIGITMIMGFDFEAGETFLGFTFLIGIFLIPKALGRFGYSMGIASAFKAAGGMAASGIRFTGSK